MMHFQLKLVSLVLFLLVGISGKNAFTTDLYAFANLDDNSIDVGDDGQYIKGRASGNILNDVDGPQTRIEQSARGLVAVNELQSSRARAIDGGNHLNERGRFADRREGQFNRGRFNDNEVSRFNRRRFGEQGRNRPVGSQFRQNVPNFRPGSESHFNMINRNQATTSEVRTGQAADTFTGFFSDFNRFRNLFRARSSAARSAGIPAYEVAQKPSATGHTIKAQRLANKFSKRLHVKHGTYTDMYSKMEKPDRVIQIPVNSNEIKGRSLKQSDEVKHHLFMGSHDHRYNHSHHSNNEI